MCRSIKKLYSREHAPTDLEIYEATLQFVRKVSGMRVPSQKNRMVFDTATKEISGLVAQLCSSLKK